MKQIQLTKGLFAVVDDEDFMNLSATRWCVSDGYAFNAKLGRMHRAILRAPDGVMVDHINGDKLDNRRENLRLCTNSQNQANRKVSQGVSKFKGVVWQKLKSGKGYWKACITKDGVTTYLGTYPTDVEAAAAYNVAAVSMFGEFAHQNNLTLTKSVRVSRERKQVNRKSGSSNFKGVGFDAERGKWVARLIYKSVRHLHKRFDNEVDAAKAYDEVAVAVFGTDAQTNF